MKIKNKNLILTPLILLGLFISLSSVSATTTTKTLYAWVKDQAGNISTSQSDSVTITISEGTTYYISPTGSDTTGDGSIGSPWFTLNKALIQVEAGDTIYMRGGTYFYTNTQAVVDKNGSEGNTIKIWGYDGERPVIDYSSINFTSAQSGLYISNSDYIHFKNIRITNMIQPVNEVHNGISVYYNSDHNIFENIEVDHIGGYGFVIGNSSYNLFLNSDAHHLADPYSAIPYEGSNGFSMTGQTNAEGNIFRGCRAWYISDDGWDFFLTSNNYTIENSWSFWNGYAPGTFNHIHANADGNGFKLGPSPFLQLSTSRFLKNNLAFENYGNGFDQNIGNSNQVYPATFYNNIAYKNGVQSGSMGFWFWNFTAVNVFKNNIAYDNAQNTAINPESIQDHNSWDSAVTVSDDDFLSVSSIGADGQRQADGSLPNLNFLKLAPNSDLINAGTNVGLPYNGSAPDIGAYESNY